MKLPGISLWRLLCFSLLVREESNILTKRCPHLPSEVTTMATNGNRQEGKAPVGIPDGKAVGVKVTELLCLLQERLG